jgi:hypothetical protein
MLPQAWWREGVKEEKSRPAVTSCKDPYGLIISTVFLSGKIAEF